MPSSAWSAGSRIVATAAVATALAAAPGLAGDEYDETEERLKIAGVAQDVRTRIHRAIDLGVKFLLARQSKDGAFRDGVADGGAMVLDGQTALASLALAHARGAAARDGAERGLAYLFPGGRPRAAVVGKTYDAGITAMLVAALRADASFAKKIGWYAAGGCRSDSAWWDYDLGGLSEDELLANPTTGAANLSTTQFGAIALWAATRAGGVEYPATWRRHLVSLCAQQKENGSWGYWASRPEPDGRGYPNGTCMGFANLTLAAAALADDLPDDPVLAARTELARRRAREALDRDGPVVLDLGASGDGIDYYGYYALEKACVFAEIDKVGGRSWYLAGAGRLLAVQEKAGGWGSSRRAMSPGIRFDAPGWSIVNTSFALLFLLRASETFRPTTPRDAARGPVTPSSPAPRVAPAAPPVPTTPVAANAALDRLDALVKGRDVPLAADLVRAIDDVARAQREFAETLDDAWRDREEKLLLRAFGDALDPTSQRRDAAVAEHAADALGGCRPAVAPPLRTEVAAVLEKDGVPPPSRAVLGAAFGSLARLGGDATFDWLARRITDSTRAADVRAARAAMGALAKFDGAGAMDRLSTASRIVRLLEPIEAAAADSKETEFRSLVAKTLVASLGAAGLEALEALATDRASGEPPWGADGTPFLTFAAWGKWLSSHRDASAAPWK